jgi:hypothetical protein
MRARNNEDDYSFLEIAPVLTYFHDADILPRTMFSEMIGGNILDVQHVRNFLAMLKPSQHCKAGACLFFHEHFVSVLKTPLPGVCVVYDLIESMPLLTSHQRGTRTRCYSVEALEVLLRYYCASQFTRTQCVQIEGSIYNELMSLEDPRTFQAMVYSGKNDVTMHNDNTDENYLNNNVQQVTEQSCSDGDGSSNDGNMLLTKELSQENREVVLCALYGAGELDEIVAQVGTDSVQHHSMHTLWPGVWVNDEVIHLYWTLLAKREEELLCRGHRSRKANHFFKSFFFTRALNQGHEDPAMDGMYDYRRVQRWSRSVEGGDIFQFNKLFFAINIRRTHWFCAVAFMEEKCIRIYDSLGPSSRHAYYLNVIFQYLQDEHKDKKGIPLPDIDSWDPVASSHNTPVQLNGKVSAPSCRYNIHGFLTLAMGCSL